MKPQQAYALGKAFRLGYAFALGIAYKRNNLAQDADNDDVIFRTSKKGKPYAIDPKTGTIKGGLGKENNGVELREAENTGKSFEDFIKENNLEINPETGKPKQANKSAKAYIKALYKNTKISNPNGLPKSSQIEFTNEGLSKTARAILSSVDKAQIAGNLPDIYKTGQLIASKRPDIGKHQDTHRFYYFEKTENVNGKPKKVQLDLMRKINDIKKRNRRYVHYTISKADDIDKD